MIKVNIASVPADVKEVLFVASIYQAQQKGQSLKDLDNAHIRIVNEEGQQEIANVKISGNQATGESFVLGKLVREGDEWNFVAIVEPEAGELSRTPHPVRPVRRRLTIAGISLDLPIL